MERLDFCALDRHLALVDHKVVLDCVGIEETDVIEGIAIRTEDVSNLADDLGQIAKFRYGGATFAELCVEDEADESLSAALAAEPLGKVVVSREGSLNRPWPDAKAAYEAMSLASQICGSMQGALAVLDALLEERDEVRVADIVCVLQDSLSLCDRRANDIVNLMDAPWAPNAD